jgi:hypothetical protein
MVQLRIKHLLLSFEPAGLAGGRLNRAVAPNLALDPTPASAPSRRTLARARHRRKLAQGARKGSEGEELLVAVAVHRLDPLDTLTILSESLAEDKQSLIDADPIERRAPVLNRLDVLDVDAQTTSELLAGEAVGAAPLGDELTMGHPSKYRGEPTPDRPRRQSILRSPSPRRQLHDYRSRSCPRQSG